MDELIRTLSFLGVPALLSSLFIWKIRRIQEKIVANDKKSIAIEMGMQALLRDRIIQAYNHYIDLGYCPIYGKENVTNMYEQYHRLGGNGTVTKLYGEILELPTEKRKG